MNRRVSPNDPTQELEILLEPAVDGDHCDKHGQGPGHGGTGGRPSGPGPAAARVVVMFLECLEEQFIIFGVRIAGVVNVVIRRVDPGRRKLQTVLKYNKKSIKFSFVDVEDSQSLEKFWTVENIYECPKLVDKAEGQKSSHSD